MVLDLIARLYDAASRLDAARKLAEYFGSDNLVIFINDPDIGLMLPAPGFIQTLQNGPLWKSFLLGCEGDYCRGKVPYPQRESMTSATGITAPDGSIAVLIGGYPEEDQMTPLKALLPLLTTLLKQEQQMIAHKSLALTAEGTARKAEKVARNLEIIRQDLRKALKKQETDKRAIEELMSKKDEFMNIASHELKTPLTSMRSYVQIISRRLNKTFPDQLLLDFTEKANRQTDKLMVLVNDLFDLSKIQAGKMQFNFSWFDLNDLIHECIEQMRNTIETHRIIVKGQVNTDILADRNRLEQVFNNLLSNAVKYSPGADSVLVELGQHEKTVEVKITDYGIGIPSEDLPNICERFFRVEASSTNFNGLGLGLYITSQIIKGHSGELVVESEISKGSTFNVKIPIL